MSAKFFAELTALRRLAEQQAADIAELRGQIDGLAREVVMLMHRTDPAALKSVAADNLPSLPPSARKARSNGYKRT